MRMTGAISCGVFGTPRLLILRLLCVVLVYKKTCCMVGYDKVCGLQQTYFLLCETLSENVHYYEFGSDGWQHVFSLYG